MNEALHTVLALPEEEQLEAALGLLRDLTCDDEQAMTHYRTRFGFPRSQAKIVHYLVRRAPRPCSREQIFAALYGVPLEPRNPKVVDVFLSKSRTVLRASGVEIRNHHGTGWSLSAEDAAALRPPELEPTRPVAVPVEREGNGLSRQRTPWLPGEAEEMCDRRDSGWDWWALADQYCRTERAVMETYRRVRGTNGPRQV